MKVVNKVELLLSEHQEACQLLNEEKFNDLYKELNLANRIFVSAAGRSLLQIKGFAMRLMHIDYNVVMVNEITTPAITKDDLLIVASGSGETTGIINQVNKAKNIGARTIAITLNPNSTLAIISDDFLLLPKITSKVTGGTQFEQFLGITLDAFIVSIMEDKNMDNNYIFKNHSNLE